MENVNMHFTVSDRKMFEAKMLNWLKRFNIFSFLNNNNFNEPEAFPCFIAAGIEREIVLKRDEDPFRSLQAFHDQQPSWLFGHLNYELNTGIKQTRTPEVCFPGGYFFSPQFLISLKGNDLQFLKCHGNTETIFEEIMAMPETVSSGGRTSSIRSRITRDEYIEAIENIRRHIKLGDCYELNFCQEFVAETSLSPQHLYKKLNEISPQPFSAFYRYGNFYCCCASPERFLKKAGRHLLSQPIKGTAPRGADALTDLDNFKRLAQSSKDRSENVMVVDLVRNDLSRICKPGSVKVPELFSVKTFPGVHQMISSVTGEMENSVPFSEALNAAFPMGSMTGAPKISVMNLIEKYETSARGLFSGSIGYITPEGDFDFNVVIRSIFIDTEKNNLSFMAGGGITHYSDAAAEYDESILKTVAIRKVLNAG